MPLTRKTHTSSRMRNKDERVLIIAPVGQDAEAMAALLYAEGFETQICAWVQMNVRDKSLTGAGALLLTEEALESPQVSNLLDVLKAQPALVRITAHHSHKRRRIAPGRDYWIWRLRLPELLLCWSGRSAPCTLRPVNAGCITFSATAISGARSRHPTRELK